MVIFIVGNSRSGTTMMGRILNRHEQIHTFNELHFFERLYDFQKHNYDYDQAVNLSAILLRSEKDFYFSTADLSQFKKESQEILGESEGESLHAIDVFMKTLGAVVKEKNKTIPCEQTPRNVFFINEITRLIPEARFVNMIRDPRDILLSQKNKWKRRNLGASRIPLTEALRSWFNYHPITISTLWNSSISSAYNTANQENILNVKYEDLLSNSEVEMKRICEFLDIQLDPNMTKITQVGSSTSKDSDEKGLNKDNINKWKNGGLTNEEIHICNNICSNNMLLFEYEQIRARINYVKLLVLYCTFPFKLTIALFFNLKRMKNVSLTIKKRLLKSRS